MKALFGRRSAVITVVIAAALVLTGCSKNVNDAASGTSGNCGAWSIAMHAWTGYTASAQVVAEVAKKNWVAQSLRQLWMKVQLLMMQWKPEPLM